MTVQPDGFLGPTLNYATTNGGISVPSSSYYLFPEQVGTLSFSSRIVNNSRRRGAVQLIQQSTADNVRIFIQRTDNGAGFTGQTANLTIQASKKGTSTFSTITPTVTEIGNGWYDLALTSTHTNTLGNMTFHITLPNGVGNDDLIIQIVAFNPNDANALGLGTITLPSGAVVTNGSNTSATFQTNFSSTTNNTYNNGYLVFTSGTLINQVQKVSGYSGSTFFITVGSAFTGSPSGGDTFYIINR